MKEDKVLIGDGGRVEKAVDLFAFTGSGEKWMTEIDHIFARHKNIALQFSGGKDSLALLYLMQNYWNRLFIYHLNTGDEFPETREIVERVKAVVPNFVEVAGRTKQVHSEFGIPSDVVPTSSSLPGRLVIGHKNPLITDRYVCCFQSIMVPLMERMLHDGMTLLIRGQKNADKYKPVTRSGDVIEGIELLYPLESWTHDQTLQYLKDRGIPVPRFYEMMDGMPDCMSCSAWWDDGRGKYMQRYHPDAYVIYQERLNIIADAVERHVAHFSREIGCQEVQP